MRELPRTLPGDRVGRGRQSAKPRRWTYTPLEKNSNYCPTRYYITAPEIPKARRFVVSYGQKVLRKLILLRDRFCCESTCDTRIRGHRRVGGQASCHKRVKLPQSFTEHIQFSARTKKSDTPWVSSIAAELQHSWAEHSDSPRIRFPL